MENLVVTTFTNIIDATEGLDKLKELDRSCDITIYNVLLVRKRNDHYYQLLHHEGVDIGQLPQDDQLAALLYNALDRPLGIVTHIFSGFLQWTIHSAEGPNDLFEDFMAQFNKELRLSKFSIFLDVEEDDPSFIDEYMRRYQGVALRSDIVDLYRAYIEEQWLQDGKEREKWTDLLKISVNKLTQQLNARISILDEKIHHVGTAAKDKIASRKARLEQQLQRLNFLY